MQYSVRPLRFRVALAIALGLATSACSEKETRRKIVGTQTTLMVLGASLNKFDADMGRYPKTLDELVNRPADYKGNWPAGGYEPKIPVDGWGRAFIYQMPGKKVNWPTIISLGADGKKGGEGADADIVVDLP